MKIILKNILYIAILSSFASIDIAFAGGTKTITVGESAIISWSNVNGSCVRSINPDPGNPVNIQWSGIQTSNTSGTTVVGPFYIPGVYNFVCDNGLVADDVVITVLLNPSISSSPNIASGKSPTVTWSASTPDPAFSVGASCQIARTVYYNPFAIDAWQVSNTSIVNVGGNGILSPEIFTSTPPSATYVHYKVMCWKTADGSVPTSWVYAPTKTTVGNAKVWFSQ